MYVIITSSGRPLKGEYSGNIETFSTLAAAQSRLNNLIDRARYPKMLANWKIQEITK